MTADTPDLNAHHIITQKSELWSTMRHLGVEVDALMIAELVELYPAMMAVATGAATLLEIEGFRPRA